MKIEETLVIGFDGDSPGDAAGAAHIVAKELRSGGDAYERMASDGRSEDQQHAYMQIASLLRTLAEGMDVLKEAAMKHARETVKDAPTPPVDEADGPAAVEAAEQLLS